MELYTLDDTFRRTRVIDRFESLIWTERYTAFGDFELQIASTQDTRNTLANDTHLGVNTSLGVMTIETTVDKKDSTGKRILTVKGRSLEAILLDRIAQKTFEPAADTNKGTAVISIAAPAVVNFFAHGFATGDAVYFTTTGALPTGVDASTLYYVIFVDANNFRLATTYENAILGTAITTTGTQSGVHSLIKYGNSKWIMVDTPGNVARRVFEAICVNNIAFPSDNIPLINYPASLFPADTIVEPTAVISVEITRDFAYNVIKSILETYDMGFRLYRGFDDQKLYFNVYSGSDRTTGQSVLPPVIFSPALDNLTDTEELSSIAVYKNVAYVVAPNGTMIVYATGADSTTSGFKRHVMYVDASSVTELPGTILNDKLLKMGQDALAGQRSLTAFDGQIPQNSKYRYLRDYFLGDLVEKRNDDGVTNNMRVTEQIMSQDAQGEKSYPTLASYQLITPGSWQAWESNQAWDDVPDAKVWDNA